VPGVDVRHIPVFAHQRAAPGIDGRHIPVLLQHVVVKIPLKSNLFDLQLSWPLLTALLVAERKRRQMRVIVGHRRRHW